MRGAADRAPASSEVIAQLAALAAENARLREETTRLQDALAQAQAVIAALRRQLFGAKADRLTPEQEAQLLALQRDVVDEAERPRPPSDDVLTEERPVDRPRPPRRARQPLPDHLETETVVLEPDDTRCPGCGQPSRRIGEEVTEEIDLVPAKLIRRRIVRPKIRVPLRHGRRRHRHAPAAPDSPEYPRVGLGRPHPVDALRRPSLVLSP